MTHQHPIIARLAVVTLCLCSAALGATTSRDITLQHCRHIPQRSQSTPQPIPHHATSPAPTNHANHH